MNREDIIRMAEEAGAIHYWHLSNLERFAALVASAERERLTDAAMKSAEKAVDVAIALEREACAEIADRLPRIFRETQQAHYRHSPEPFKPERLFDLAELRQAEKITQAIRARDNHEQR